MTSPYSLTGAGGGMSSSVVPNATNIAATGATDYSLAAGGAKLATPATVQLGAGAGASNTGLLSSIWNGLGPYGKAAAVTGGTQMFGSLMQGYGMQQQQRRAEQMAEEQRARYNRNVGGYRYG